MTAEQWEHIQTIFLAALTRPLADRGAFLDTACAGAPDIRREVESLLAEAEQPGPIDALANELVGPIAARWRTIHAAGDRVGAYRIVQEVGRGGMGTVYRAERADGQFEQQVALKVMRERAADEERAARFLHERQILARLAHPNIARLLDGGVTDDGAPFFVMEYVDGQPIDTYCDTHRLTIDERLDRFDDVGTAVQHAHQNLVVHRDLKPSNILVTEAGEVKLLDFGIAKLLEALPEEGPRTRTGLQLMTPEYAAPEQVRRAPITTATDVYALGVLLYELLTGRRPYRVAGKSPQAIEQTISETDPAPPSEAVRQTGDGHAISAARATTPDRLARRLAGDLDTIVLKALQKEPGRRYASVEALRDDVRRHREGVPVRARPNTLRYRAARFVRRHRTAVGAAALLGLTLLAGIVGTTWQALRASEQARLVAAERDRAQHVTDFLVDLFRAPDPSTSRGDTLTAYDLLDQGVQQVSRTLQGQPLTRAAMLNALGRTHVSMGQYGQAASLLDSALALRQRHGAPPADRAQSLSDRGLAATLQGDFAGAESLLTAAHRLYQHEAEGNEVHRARLLVRLANLYHETAVYDSSEHFYRTAVDLLGRTESAPPADHASALQHLALLLQERGRGDEAVPIFEEALAMQRTTLAAPHPEIALLLNDYGMTLQGLGRMDEAEAVLRESLAMQRAVFGPVHPQIVYTLTNLATVVDDYDLEAADRLMQDAQQAADSLFAPTNPVRIVTRGLRANVLRQKGALAEAQAVYREALRGAEQAFPAGHPRVAWIQVGLGGVLLERGRPAEAVSLLREGGMQLTEQFGATHPLTVRAQRGQADALIALDRHDEAEAVLRAQYDELVAADGASGDQAQATAQRLVALYDAWGRPSEADRYRAVLSGS